ncbi:MAG: flagellar filament capping protein FliD [Desulfuromonadaceae bacterium]|nr:flagellar filament capping protein FliD [Desulfuromonadaceae bacterium]
MSEITFGGLATGLDTDSIIEALMEIERQPVEALENDLSYYESETTAFAKLNTLLGTLQDSVEAMDTIKEISAFSATASDSSLLTATTDSSASAGTYHIEIVSLAESQKDVSSEGFADTSSATLSGTLTIGDTTIDYSEVSLKELAKMVNNADAGMSATIINDGTENGYRLVLTGDQAGVTTEIVGTGSISIDTATDGHTYDASQAHIILDNVDIYSNDNTLTEAISGVTLDLLEAEEGKILTLTVESDTDAIESAMDDFVDAYNDIIGWMSDQSDSDWGSDSVLRSLKSKMQVFLTTRLFDNGSFSSLASIGFKTDFETGEISIDSSTLSDALSSDLDSVLSLFAGNESAGSDGIADLFADFLDDQTSSVDGIYARRKKSNDEKSERINSRIEMMELRLEKREENLREQYTALENLVSELNTQLSYIEAIGS